MMDGIIIDTKGTNFWDEDLKGITNDFITVLDYYLSLNPDGVSVQPNRTIFKVIIDESEFMDDIMGDLVKGLIISGFGIHAGKNTHNNKYWINITYAHLKMMLKHYVEI